MTSITVSETTLSRIWNAGWHAPEMRTTDGSRLRVVYHGVWSFSDGPDFRGALLEIDGRLVRGSVELHHRSSDWRRHRHQHDPAYDEVVLHVVLDDDQSATTSSGSVPWTLRLDDFLSAPLEELQARAGTELPDWLGTSTCLPTLASQRPELVRAVLRAKGWERLTGKQLRFMQEMERLPPGEVWYLGLLESLGLSGNRAQMRTLGDAAPLWLLDHVSAEIGLEGSLALLLGLAGFLPMSPAHQKLAGLGPNLAGRLAVLSQQLSNDGDWAPLPAEAWQLKRVRPLNHPVRRLSSLASLAAGTAEDGLFGGFLAIDPGPDGAGWRDWLSTAQPAIGPGRQEQIVTNVFAPFMAAYVDLLGDEGLAAAVAERWERLPGTLDDQVGKTTLRRIIGPGRFPIRHALEEQGLHQIGRFGCAELRCLDCPIAALATEHELGITPDQAAWRRD